MRFTIIAALSLSFIPLALSAAVSDNVLSLCQSPQVVDERFIGQDKNVRLQALKCANSLIHERETSLEKRQTLPIDVCGNECDTNCFVPAGGGPDPNECHVISDALLFDSQNIGALFNITTNAAVITMTFRSCESFFVNQAGVDLQYCRTDWSTVLDFVAFNCQATQNAHGGNCVAADQRWFIQVQNSSG
ncbi:hypothetical protein EIP91_001460 [Steccherinum ochraceum]|uniref:Cyanovirin-N domain-containing protein n=1 Tax=Steccherinum ochraceum TaxID=92696 RepID=A0A4R0RKA6_9APHY|nr:hypothetical protein EIP91_001460 [Steccherinum ochraceum]